jgi:superfamily II DNA helicase RecQ
MKLKVFHVRLTKEHFEADQEAINYFLRHMSVNKVETELVTGQPNNYWSILIFYDDKVGKQNGKISVTEKSDLTADEIQIFEALKHWRSDKGSKLHIPNFMVCHNTELMTIAKVIPKTLGEFSKIKGFSDGKIAKFGEEIIAVLNSVLLVQQTV